MSAVPFEPSRDRAAIRRAIWLRCEAVSLSRYAMLGTWVLDVSKTGLLVAADELGERNEPVLVHLYAGGEDLVAQAEVARVVHGRRPRDEGPALGLRFTRSAGRGFRDLLDRLRGTPPPVPRRRVRRDYARAVNAIRFFG